MSSVAITNTYICDIEFRLVDILACRHGARLVSYSVIRLFLRSILFKIYFYDRPDTCAHP